MNKNLTKGYLIADKDDLIIQCNTSAQNMCNLKDPIGLGIDKVLQRLHEEIEIEIIVLDQGGQGPLTLYQLSSRVDTDKRFYEKVVENCYDEIFVSSIDTTCLYVNPVFERHYNVDRSELINSRNFMTKNSMIDTSPIYVALETKRPATIDVKTATGKILLISSKPVFDENGKIEFVVSTSRDISELRCAQEEAAYALSLVEKYEDKILETHHHVTNKNALIFKSEEMKKMMEIVHRIGRVDSTVLITGESGTGKTAIAHQIHTSSSRKDKPFVTIDCTAIPESLIESELFGYVSGAFTGASSKGKKGLISVADGGTLFFDEIGELPLNIQSKLLLFLQSHSFTPVGGTEMKKVDVRVIAATNQPLMKNVENKLFREDLYYRLNVVEVKVPALRERKDDILPLVVHFQKQFDQKYYFDHKLSKATIELLLKYPWPGNIRELQNVIENLVVTTVEYVIEPHHFPEHFINTQISYRGQMEKYPISLEETIYDFEKTMFLKAYHLYDSTYKVAEALGITQSKVMRLKKKYMKNESNST